jgi:hypothetical protein
VLYSPDVAPEKTVDLVLQDGSEMTVKAADVLRASSIVNDVSLFRVWIALRPSSRGPSESEFVVAGDIGTFRAAMRAAGIWAAPQ